MDKWSTTESCSSIGVEDVVDRGGDVVLIDVREHHEWAAGHIATAVHIPLGDIDAWDVPDLAGRPLAIICRSGNRSMKAAVLLDERGIKSFNVEGGMRAWQSANLEFVSDDGSPAEVI